jgi:LysM domain
VYDRTQYSSNEDLIMEDAMSALPAIELTCGSDIRPVRVLRPVRVPSGPRAGEPGLPDDAPGPQRGALIPRRDTPTVRHAGLVPRRDTPRLRRDTPAARSARAARSGRSRDTLVAPLRLTRRGRVVAATTAALLVTVVSLLLAGVAQATNDGPSSRAARQNLVQVVVHAGQSLWSVAESADPDQDPRAVTQQIIDLNSLNGDTVFAGQQLWVPHG